MLFVSGLCTVSRSLTTSWRCAMFWGEGYKSHDWWEEETWLPFIATFNTKGETQKVEGCSLDEDVMGGQSQTQLTWKSHKTSHGNEKRSDDQQNQRQGISL